ncbi:MAG: hypothetical protein ABI644_05810 [Arenimonas sp.]
MTKKYWLELGPALLIGAAIILAAFIAGPDSENLVLYFGIASWFSLQARNENTRKKCRNI